MQKIAKSAVVLVILAAAALPLVLPVLATAAIEDSARTAACEGLGAAGTDCSDAQASSGISGLIATAVNILSWAVGVVAVIMIIVGGFKYVVSAGDSNGISSAKNTIIYALIGLIIALVAQGLVRFVLNRSTAPPASEPSGAVELAE